MSTKAGHIPIASALSVTRSVFMRIFRFLLGQCIAAIYIGTVQLLYMLVLQIVQMSVPLRQLVLSSSTKICFAIFHSIFYIRVHCLYYSIYIHTLSVSFYIHCLYYSIYTVCIVEICENSKQHRISFSCETPHTPYTCVQVCVCVCVSVTILQSIFTDKNRFVIIKKCRSFVLLTKKI